MEGYQLTVPSVTQVLGVWSRFDYVQEWVLREAAERGTEVHQAATAYIRGVYIKPLSVDRAGYFLSFKKWFESYVETVFATECRLTCETFGFTGKMDLVARLKDRSVLVIDLKTPTAEQRSWRVQVAAYVYLFNEKMARCEMPVFIDGAGCLRLFSSGKCGKMSRYQDTAEDWKIFLSALNCYKFFNEGGTK
jgi:hypothetical protein